MDHGTSQKRDGNEQFERNLNDQLQERDIKIQNLEEDCKKLKASVEFWQNRVSTLAGAKLTDVNPAITDKNEELAFADSEKDALTERSVDCSYNKFVANNEVMLNVQEQLKEKESQLRQLQQKQQKREESLAEIERTFKADNERLRSALKEKEEDIKNTKHNLTETMKKLKDLEDDKRKRVTQLERELEGSKQELEKQNKEHQENLQALRTTKKEIEKENISLKAQLEQQKLRDLEMSKKIYDEQQKAKNSQRKQAIVYNEEISNLREQLKEKDVEIKQLEEKQTKWEETITDIETLKAENNSQSSRARQLQRELEDTKQQFKKQSEEFQEWTEAIEGMTETMEKEKFSLRNQIQQQNIREKELLKKLFQEEQKVKVAQSEKAEALNSQSSRARQLQRELEENKQQLKEQSDEHNEWVQTVECMMKNMEKESLIVNPNMKLYKLEQQKLGEKELVKELNEEEQKVVQSEKTEALNSNEMGTKLIDNNPVVADLSDPNRATKLADMYNELYENEWTDALEIFKEKLGEEEAMRYLLDTVKKVYTFCNEKAQTQIEELGKIFFKQKCSDSSDMRMVSRFFKDQRKSNAEEFEKDIYEEFIKSHGNRVSSLVPEYLKKVVRLCWLMCVQDPPVALGKEAVSGDEMDYDLYKAYTNAGKTVSYTVWLPLLLHDGGALLSIGVAQPVKEDRMRVKSVPTRNRTRDPKNNMDAYLYAHTSTADTHSSPDERWAIDQIGRRKEYSPRSRQAKADDDDEVERNEYSPKTKPVNVDDGDASKLLAMHDKRAAFESLGQPKMAWGSTTVNSVQQQYETGGQHKSYGSKYNVSPGRVSPYSSDSSATGYNRHGNYTYMNYSPYHTSGQQHNYQQTLHPSSGNKGKLSQGVANNPYVHTYTSDRSSGYGYQDHGIGKTNGRRH